MCPQASPRWCPTPEQLMILEELYRSGIRTPNTTQIQQITAHLAFYGRIEGKNVFYWFQNHKARDRQKLRKKLSRQLRQQQLQPQLQPQPRLNQHAMYQPYYNINHHHHLPRQYKCNCAFRHMVSSSASSLTSFSNPPAVCLPPQGINGEARSKELMKELYHSNINTWKNKDDNITGSSYYGHDDWMMMMLMMDISSSSSSLPCCNTITVPKQPAAPLKTLELFPKSSCNFKEA